MENSMRSSAINYGLYLGIFYALLTISFYTINLEWFTQWWLNIVLLLIAIIVGVVSVAKAKSINGGFLSFKEAFSSFFITLVIGSLISMAVTIVLFNFVDPEAAATLKEKAIEVTAKTMERWNTPEEIIDQTITDMEAQDNMFAPLTQLKNTIFGFVFYAVIGLIVALIMKKNNPDE